jgi:hypothetical protein
MEWLGFERLRTKKRDELFKQDIKFCSLDHAFSNCDERKTNEMHFQSKSYI